MCKVVQQAAFISVAILFDNLLIAWAMVIMMMVRHDDMLRFVLFSQGGNHRCYHHRQYKQHACKPVPSSVLMGGSENHAAIIASRLTEILFHYPVRACNRAISKPDFASFVEQLP